MNKQGMARWIVPALALAFAGIVWAKLPPPTEEQKAKAAEAKAKAADADKKAADQLTAAQDRVAARYIAEQKAKGKEVHPTPIAAATPAPAAPAPSAAPAASAKLPPAAAPPAPAK
jgi:hypothetical protein